MTRIIGGFAGSLRLEVPRAGTRPTSDRVREAIFSALDARGLIEGARVLDLYAGSGALGLEAASRGAAHVTLVERAGSAARVARANAARVTATAPRGATPVVEVWNRAVQAFLDGAAGLWDVVFLDPPYELGDVDLVRDLESLLPLLAPDAVVVVERSSRGPDPVWPTGFEQDRRNDYGETAVFRLQPAAPSQSS